MLFNSFEFIFFFLPLVLAGFLLIARGLSGVVPLSSYWLFAASLYFYYQSGTPAGWLIVVSILVNFGIGRLLLGSTPYRLQILVAGVSLNIAAIVFYKYTNFLLAELALLLAFPAPAEHIGLPIGISFFTFTQIAYLVDIYRDPDCRYDLGRYGLFVTFFPHLIAGPILHHKEMLPQFERFDRKALYENLAVGMTIFTIGLVKKVYLADSLAKPANLLFDGVAAGAVPGVLEAWLGVAAYSFQLYFDFSGYSDMAVGLARLFGVRFPINFASPYKADSLVDFWRRWHITLSRFLRDYLYFTLGGNRCSPWRQRLNLLLTMLLGGLWHGAGWTYIVWGGLHGLGLLLVHGWQQLRRGRTRFHPLLARLITLAFVFLAWVPFRASNMDVASSIWQGMFCFSSASASLPLVKVGVISLVLAAWMICWFLPATHEILTDHQPGLASPGYPATESGAHAWSLLRWRPAGWMAVLTAFALLMCILKLSDLSQFIYFQF